MNQHEEGQPESGSNRRAEKMAKARAELLKSLVGKARAEGGPGKNDLEVVAAIDKSEAVRHLSEVRHDQELVRGAARGQYEGAWIASVAFSASASVLMVTSFTALVEDAKDIWWIPSAVGIAIFFALLIAANIMLKGKDVDSLTRDSFSANLAGWEVLYEARIAGDIVPPPTGTSAGDVP